MVETSLWGFFVRFCCVFTYLFLAEYNPVQRRGKQNLSGFFGMGKAKKSVNKGTSSVSKKVYKLNKSYANVRLKFKNSFPLVGLSFKWSERENNSNPFLTFYRSSQRSEAPSERVLLTLATLPPPRTPERGLRAEGRPSSEIR